MFPYKALCELCADQHRCNPQLSVYGLACTQANGLVEKLRAERAAFLCLSNGPQHLNTKHTLLRYLPVFATGDNLNTN